MVHVVRDELSARTDNSVRPHESLAMRDANWRSNFLFRTQSNMLGIENCELFHEIPLL